MDSERLIGQYDGQPLITIEHLKAASTAAWQAHTTEGNGLDEDDLMEFIEAQIPVLLREQEAYEAEQGEDVMPRDVSVAKMGLVAGICWGVLAERARVWGAEE